MATLTFCFLYVCFYAKSLFFFLFSRSPTFETYLKVELLREQGKEQSLDPSSLAQGP